MIEHGRFMVRADELLAYIEALERPAPAPPGAARNPALAGDLTFWAGPATLDGSSKRPGAA